MADSGGLRPRTPTGALLPAPGEQSICELLPTLGISYCTQDWWLAVKLIVDGGNGEWMLYDRYPLSRTKLDRHRTPELHSSGTQRYDVRHGTHGTFIRVVSTAPPVVDKPDKRHHPARWVLPDAEPTPTEGQ